MMGRLWVNKYQEFGRLWQSSCWELNIEFLGGVVQESQNSSDPWDASGRLAATI